MGRLLGDPEVWDDPSRPRPALRGLVRLATGAAAGLLLALAVVPAPGANVRQVVELLKEARDDLATTVVVVTHDAEVAAAMDRAVTIRDGRVSAEGRGGAGDARSSAPPAPAPAGPRPGRAPAPGPGSRSRSTATRWC